MHTILLPLLVVVSFGVIPVVSGQGQSVLALEPKHGKLPFQKGEQLDIRCDTTILTGVTRITVLDTDHWPWVRVQVEQGETWLNFDHVVMASRVSILK